jgi:transcriptional regulator with XRE-family HTH domain
MTVAVNSLAQIGSSKDKLTKITAKRARWHSFIRAYSIHSFQFLIGHILPFYLKKVKKQAYSAKIPRLKSVKRHAFMKNNNINRLLGAKIRNLRLNLGMTQAELAEKMDTSLKHFGELERGRGNPSLKTLKAVARVLDVQIFELFYFGKSEYVPEQITKSEQALLKELIEKVKVANPEVIRLLHLIMSK